MNETTSPAEPSPEALTAALLDLLTVEQIDDLHFRGARKPGGIGRVFGGQVIAQALAAATRTAPAGRNVHSLHAYFMRGGDEDYPIDFRVEADFDGGSFSNRRVVASQNGEPILNLVASFQRPEGGLSHQDAMPDVPPPESLVDQRTFLRANEDLVPRRLRHVLTRPNAVEMRPVDPGRLWRLESHSPDYLMWFRVRAPLDVAQEVHRIILAYVTDYGLLGTAMLPHLVDHASPKLQVASLDHALWFHDDVKVDDWLLYMTDSPWSGHARGFNRGMIFTQEGRLVASVAQEGLMRVRS